ncbi:MAG: yjeF-like protein [Rhodobacteraceae bacterium]|nr:MAG: yjeF-like protein [Paracoccaceae bacterium]
MTELLTAAQMRAIEQAAIASGEVTGLELMERAGRGVVEAIFEEWPALNATSHRAVVLCGPGNNGGDGFVVARLLKEWGWEVEVFLYGDPDRMPPDARVNYERWLGMGEVGELGLNLSIHSIEPNLVVDALFGTGLSRPVTGIGLTLLEMHEERQSLWTKGKWGVAHVAIDLPSGLCSDSGRPLKSEQFRGIGEGVAAASTGAADLTVTFHSMKLGHVLADGPDLCGKVKVCDIGLSAAMDAVKLYEPWVRDLGKRFEHKYSHGHALILSGPSGRGGAARLAARGALRIGAGVVTVGCPTDAIPENAARLDAVMLRGVVDGLALEEALADPRINALCVGPGLGLAARGREVVAVALKCRSEARPTSAPVGRASDRHSLCTVVLDADALTILSQNPDLFAALPHAGEFARLFPDIAEKLAAPATKGPAYSKVDATREAAKRAGCVVLYKGPDTVIADPTGRCAINSAHYDRAAPWLATAGSGDVLAGFITGLLARGFSPFDAACTGAWLHVECALSFGPGLIAEDLPEELPKVFRALGL